MPNIQIQHPPSPPKTPQMAVFFSLKKVAKVSEVILKQAILPLLCKVEVVFRKAIW